MVETLEPDTPEFDALVEHVLEDLRGACGRLKVEDDEILQAAGVRLTEVAELGRAWSAAAVCLAISG